MSNPGENLYVIKTIRADAILTGAYVAGTIIPDCQKYNQLMLFLKMTKGSITSIQIKVEYSHDGITYYQETFTGLSGGTATESAGIFSFTLTADQNFKLAIPIKCSHIKVWAKGTGTLTNSALEIKAVLGNT